MTNLSNVFKCCRGHGACVRPREQKRRQDSVSIHTLQLNNVRPSATFNAKRSDDEDNESYRLVKVA